MYNIMALKIELYILNAIIFITVQYKYILFHFEKSYIYNIILNSSYNCTLDK